MSECQENGMIRVSPGSQSPAWASRWLIAEGVRLQCLGWLEFAVSRLLRRKA
jgi:hypothetical protein